MMTFTHDDTRGRRPLSRRCAADIMSLGLLSFDSQTPVREAALMLEAHGLDAAPVVDERRRPLGLVTAAGCDAWTEFTLRSSGGGVDFHHVKGAVAEIVDPLIETIAAGASREEVIERLQADRVRRLYVVAESGAVIGVISTSDLLRDLTTARPQISRLPVAVPTCRAKVEHLAFVRGEHQA